MKTSLSISILFFTLLTFSFAQETPYKFGEIRLTEFNFQYQKEPEAEAIILSDIGESKFVISNNGGLVIQFNRTTRIKINKKSGLKYADIAIPYYVDGYGQTEKIFNIKATTYYLVNGSLQKTELDKSAIYSEKVNENWHQKKFAFPNVQKGAIIEYRYTLETPFLFNLPDWEFQSKIPTVFSSYTAKMTPFYEYVYLLKGTTHFDYQNSEQDKGLNRSFYGTDFYDLVHTFVLKNIPSFKDESYITTKDDFIKKMDFQLAKIYRPDGTKEEIITTYSKLIKSLSENSNFGKYLKKAKKLSKSILEKEINLVGKTDLEKSKIIITYVKTNYNWNGKIRKFADNSAKEVIKQKKGNSAEINLLLVALLEQAGMEVFPVIISTRSHGKIHKNYPFGHQFNNLIAIVTVDGKPFLTDATDPLIAFNRIPIQCMNDQGLVVKKDKTTWVNLYSNNRSRSTRRIIITPDLEASKMNTTVKMSFSEVRGFLYRSYYKNNGESFKKDLSERSFENIDSIKFENYNLLEKPYKVTFNGSLPMESFDDKFLISPFLDYPLQENLLKQKTRTYPVDFIYRKIDNFGSTINIPDGYMAVDLPENYELNNDLIRIVYKVEKQNKTIKITASVIYKKAIYPPENYSRFKTFLDIIVEKLNEQIVLEKV